MKRYIALYRTIAARDTQICREDPSKVTSLDDDAWEDYPDALLYIGLYSAHDEQAALMGAAAAEGCDTNCIMLIPVGDEEEFNYLLKFAAGAEFQYDERPGKQLQALWSAYCFHEALTVDHPDYSAKLLALYKQISGKHTGVQWHGYKDFVRYMSELLK